MIRKKRSRRKKRSIKNVRKNDSGGSIFNAIYDYFSPTTETDIEETKIKNKLVKILNNMIENKISKTEGLQKTVDVIKTAMKIEDPESNSIWTMRGNVGLLNWYISQIPDNKIDIKYKIANILSFVNP